MSSMNSSYLMSVICLLISSSIVLSAVSPLCDPSVSELTIDSTILDGNQLYIFTNSKLTKINLTSKEIKFDDITNLYPFNDYDVSNNAQFRPPVHLAYMHKKSSVLSDKYTLFANVCPLYISMSLLHWCSYIQSYSFVWKLKYFWLYFVQICLQWMIDIVNLSLTEGFLYTVNQFTILIVSNKWLFIRDCQWTDSQGGPGGGLLEGDLAGQRINLHRKKIHFRIIHIILNTINIKFFEESLDLVNFVNFADLPQGGGRGYHLIPLLAIPAIYSNKITILYWLLSYIGALLYWYITVF